MPIKKIISGGQTGADRGGLEAAIQTEVPHGGWCPAGYSAEDGGIPSRYCLQQTEANDYIVRTRMNVCSAHATLVFVYGEPEGGSLTTVELCCAKKKPYQCWDVLHRPRQEIIDSICHWLYHIEQYDNPPLPGFEEGEPGLVVNVAGSRESTAPGMFRRVFTIMRDVIRRFS